MKSNLPASPSPAAPTQPKIMGRDWEEIQAMQQGQNVAKRLPPVDAAKMKAAILSDVARFKIPVAVEVVNELEIELPASYRLVGGTWIHSEDSAPTAPCPSGSHLPLVAPVGVSGQTLDVPHAVCPTCGGYYDAGGTCLGCAFEDDYRPELDALAVVPAPVSPSLPAPDTLLVGDYRRNIGIDSDTVLTFEAGESVALRTTVGEVLSLPTLKADVERLTRQVSELQKALVTAQPFVPMTSHIWSNGDHGKRIYVHDVINLALEGSLSLAEVGRK
jgi:hypothetical protein